MALELKTRTLARNTIAAMMRLSGVNAVLRRVRRGSLTILCYHRVLPGTARAEYPYPQLVVTPEEFARHIEYCCKHYDCLPLREAIRRVGSRARRRRPLLTFTFDDGYADNYEHARPVLKAHGVRATFFVISSLVGSDNSLWYDRLGRALAHLRRDSLSATASAAIPELCDFTCTLKQFDGYGEPTVVQLANLAKALDPQTRIATVERVVRTAMDRGWLEDQRDRIMTEDELMQLASDGHEIASHTRSHPLLPQLSAEQILDELEESRRELASMLGEPVVSLAYPNGDYTEIVVAAARRAGYTCAVTTRAGLNSRSSNPLRLRRVFVSQDQLSGPDGELSISALELALTGLADTLLLRGRICGHS